MLDIKFIRDNKELVTMAAVKKHIDFDVEKLLAIDDMRRTTVAEVEKKRASQNATSDAIASATDPAERTRLIVSMQELKKELQKGEEALKEIMKSWQQAMVQVPNIPDISVPDGESDADNKEIKTWGEKPIFDFTPKSHIDLMNALQIVDFERGTKIAGFRGYVLKNEGALLSFAIWQAALDHFLSKNEDGEFVPMIVPSLVKRENLIGTGMIPQNEEDLYKTNDGDYLAGTAEVSTMGYHADEIFTADELPKKFLSFSPCFRREAGSHSKDVKGLIRVHEFFKLEQVVLCLASHEESVRQHEAINRNTEEFIEKLQIPYRTVVNCGGDLGLGQVKKYDIELWVPGEKTYREISSASYFHDFQTRRLNIRYRDSLGKIHYAHSLNSTAIPTPRILVSLVENFQQADGSIVIPEILQKYMGGKKLLQPKKPHATMSS